MFKALQPFLFSGLLTALAATGHNDTTIDNQNKNLYSIHSNASNANTNIIKNPQKTYNKNDLQNLSPVATNIDKSTKAPIIPQKKPEIIKLLNNEVKKAKRNAAQAKINYLMDTQKKENKQSISSSKTRVISSTPLKTLFGSTEIKRKGLKLFPKWLQVLEKNKQEKLSAANNEKQDTIIQHEDCRYDENTLCLFLDKGKYKKWHEFLKSIKTAPPTEQLTRINEFANQNIYTSDNVNWGVEDYWESPGEFLRRYGDCEDYAITKYMSLIELGWDTNKMRVVVLEDTNLNLIHVVLAVHIDDKIKILDNQHNMVVDDTRIKHYRPIFSVNEKTWWRYY
ncbi:MAG: hypothetical protein GY804_07705 [Alphaproteobacteria bacterium]|nr:hypothetical protein [Alphaproteobacteria bacterium]